MSGLAAQRLDPIILWKQKEDIRKFAHTWEFLFHHAISRGETFRLVIDMDKDSYYVLREVRKREDIEVENVDYLENLRTRKEKERRAAEDEELLEVEEEVRVDEERRTGDLTTQFFEMAFADPYGAIQLARPSELKSLAKPKELTDGLSFQDMRVEENETDSGRAFIRLSPRGSSQFAVVHFLVEEEANFTVMMNPSTGKVSIKEGYEDFKWTYGKS